MMSSDDRITQPTIPKPVFFFFCWGRGSDGGFDGSIFAYDCGWKGMSWWDARRVGCVVGKRSGMHCELGKGGVVVDG